MKTFFAEVYIPDSMWSGRYELYLVKAASHADAVQLVLARLPSDESVVDEEVVEVVESNITYLGSIQTGD